MKKTALAAGFSLIEMAFVLVIVTLLLGGLLVPFTTQVEQRRIAETQKILEEAKEALIGYALTNGYLPCPDTTSSSSSTANDGIEDVNGTMQCAAYVGNYPWATLGVGVSDAWGNHLRYQVENTFSVHIATNLTLASAGNLQICSDAKCNSYVAKNIPAVILSFGKNGYSAINANRAPGDVRTIPCPSGGCSADEAINIHDPLIPGLALKFVSRIATPAGTTAGEFDDIVTWISPNVLFNRMVAAGKLP